jgi:hypothetical protein
LKTDGSLWAWGNNVLGQLGDGTNIDKHVPTAITCPTLAVTPFEDKALVVIYPNPAKDQITLTFSETPSPFEVSITDGLGKIVFSQTYSAQNNVNIATAAFSKGIYFLTVSNQDKKQTQKLIID